MSVSEIRELLTQEFCGLPPPPEDAPIDEYHKWTVAGFFLLFCHEAASANEGKIAATNFLLENEPDPKEILPHIESALGRRLSEHELTQKAIVAV